MLEPKPDPLVLTVPAQEEFLHIIRAVVAAAGARRNLTFDAIEDLRLAVDEASSILILSSPDSGVLRLEVSDIPRGLGLTLSTDGSMRGPGGSDIGWTVLRALVDDVSLDADGPVIRIQKRGAVEDTG